MTTHQIASFQRPNWKFLKRLAKSKLNDHLDHHLFERVQVLHIHIAAVTSVQHHLFPYQIDGFYTKAKYHPEEFLRCCPGVLRQAKHVKKLHLNINFFKAEKFESEEKLLHTHFRKMNNVIYEICTQTVLHSSELWHGLNFIFHGPGYHTWLGQHEACVKTIRKLEIKSSTLHNLTPEMDQVKTCESLSSHRHPAEFFTHRHGNYRDHMWEKLLQIGNRQGGRRWGDPDYRLDFEGR